MYGNPSAYERNLAYQAQLARQEGARQVAHPPMAFLIVGLSMVGAFRVMVSDDNKMDEHVPTKLAIALFGPLFGGMVLGGWWNKRKLLKKYADDPTLIPPPAPMSPEGFRFDETPT
jgi:Na+/pantothenate symporter